MSSGTGLDDVKKRKLSPLHGLELRAPGRPVAVPTALSRLLSLVRMLSQPCLKFCVTLYSSLMRLLLSRNSFTKSVKPNRHAGSRSPGCDYF
jgi:hypothetical protein